ncbi:MAG: cupin domain-containing protein [Ralstonia sp.]|uniref:Cupin domain-containing protein n=2 Tax=Ralstonia pickettii TaxID=329 RepID=A0A2P4RFZ7_RALPI|nr:MULTISPECIES: cupin domain-containing protein [Ralstonia]MBA4202654.1 3-hydroxyanthranilate 3,4-dioxygenase [Ralstonia sp.]MBA4233531.1 3-hydroxyanthranilate 3,4-dioxygenase [Ralstonia sp.]MBA4238400.1 3-hydroxyanthranilate 3,4-dioxygenase [Ralstonia sp.]MBA4281209.1 3-hydroxyanthranilate 3,4-dioxygenase [Ralstonia sp.]MBA4294797.1 3-hydroxyanthranilate 3,4-dioxygenase [Ralstonia sp.]
MLAGHAVQVTQALEQVTDYWSPRVVGQVNDQYIKVAKLKGEFVWHDHPNEDELFFVVYGHLKIAFKDRADVHLGPGEFCVVPRGVRHFPVADEECGIMLIETVTTQHTGDVITERSVALEKQLNG